MRSFTLERTMDAPPGRVWAIVSNAGESPGPGVEVRVESAGAADGSGLVRAVRIGRSTVREEVTSVGPGRRYEYRLLGGAPVRDYVGRVSVDESAGNGTVIRWAVRFRPRIPLTGWAIAGASKRTIGKVLDLVDARTRAAGATSSE